jgi:CDP-glycerol glycerophosphotransferase
VELGYPRNDRLAMAEPAEIRTARAALGADGRRVVLYAPTHREYTCGVPTLLDPEELAEALGPQTLVLARAHYFDAGRGSSAADTPMPAHPGVRDVSTYQCIEDLLLAADVLVTDYSSVMFDYAVLDRPIVIFAPDWDAYRRTRGVTFDLLAEAPGVVATTLPDLVDAFATGAVAGEAATKARAQFRERFCYLDDGRAADRVVRLVFAEALARPG